MATFVLIHGSWHGAWCWHKIISRLEAAGHRTITPNLPAHGRDRREPGTVTLDDYVARTCEAIDMADEPVILVAHSRGGIVASQTAEARSNKISRLVYLAAFLIPNGERVLEYGQRDADSMIGANLNVNPDEGWDMLRQDVFREALYADCSDDDIALCVQLLSPEPLLPTLTLLQLTEENFGRVPRTYIELLQDRAVSPMIQKLMYDQTPCEQVISIDASHSAYFSQPDTLTDHLISLAS